MAATPEPYPSRTEPRPKLAVTPAVAKRILISMIFPTMLMPLASASTRVALPIIRNDFQLDADVTAWVAAAFVLPFMALMAVFGRLSDGLGKRRMLLAGVAVYSVGTLMTVLAPDLRWLIAGRAIQGVGGAGLTPLAMALIATVYPSGERGKALGAWTTIGPAVAFLTPLVAGFLIDQWGWRASYMPLLFFGILAFVIIYLKVPAGLSTIVPGFVRRFDWLGAALLAIFLTAFLFYLSSRPITGRMPLTDWRLLFVAVVALLLFIWLERRIANPFLNLQLFANPIFSRASACASLRMFTQSGLSILLPLYLVDVYGLSAAALGGMLMISSGAMALVTRFVGTLADRVGSRTPALIGFAVQASVMLIYSRLSAHTPLWLHGLLLIYYGLGAGAVLVALHRSAMGGLSDEEMGAAAGVYGTVRFAGSAVGTALVGALLQLYLDRAIPVIEAYQSVFFWFILFPVIGFVVGLRLYEPEVG